MGKSKRSPHRRSTPSDTRHEDVKTSDSDSDNVPTWDTSPNSLPGWLVALGECIMEDTAFAKLITVGWVMKRNDICCASQNHIDIAYRQRVSKRILCTARIAYVSEMYQKRIRPDVAKCLHARM